MVVGRHNNFSGQWSEKSSNKQQAASDKPEDYRLLTLCTAITDFELVAGGSPLIAFLLTTDH
jgi:hypothetical protein